MFISGIIAQSRSHVANALDTALCTDHRQQPLNGLADCFAIVEIPFAERARGHEGVFIVRPDLDPHLAAACFCSLRALAHAASRVALTGVILEVFAAVYGLRPLTAKTGVRVP